RIELDLRSVPENDLHVAIRRSSLVVLPYDEMHNSGAALLALSIGRPILVPRTSLNDALANEVGPEWVMRYDEPLTAEILAHAAHSASHLPVDSSPDLRERSWERIGQRTLDLYYSALHRS